MDHLPFRWRSPDGYPDLGRRWGGMHVMVSKWNFGLALAEGTLSNLDWSALAQQRAAGVANTPAAIVDYWAAALTSRSLLASDRQRLQDYVGAGTGGVLDDGQLQERLPVLVALLLDSPYGQWR
jgi:hypothetical protein